jgi:hypothetical protein
MSLINDLRIDIGDDDGVVLSGVAAPLQPAQSIGTNLGLLIRDLRVDIGDETDVLTSGIFPPPSPDGPVCWNTTFVTTNSYNMASDDVLIFVTPAAPNTTINLLPSPTLVGCIITIKDIAGTASLRNIIINPGANTIDGFTAWRMTQNKQSITITWNGIEWGII